MPCAVGTETVPWAAGLVGWAGGQEFKKGSPARQPDRLAKPPGQGCQGMPMRHGRGVRVAIDDGGKTSSSKTKAKASSHTVSTWPCMSAEAASFRAARRRKDGRKPVAAAGSAATGRRTKLTVQQKQRLEKPLRRWVSTCIRRLMRAERKLLFMWTFNAIYHLPTNYQLYA